MRLDFYLIENNLAPTRSKAQDLIKSQKISVNGKKITKPKYLVQEEDEIHLLGEIYVSRSGEKLVSFLNKVYVDFEEKVVLDVGASTGGFTEVALHRGAKKIYAIDVGTNQLENILKENERVVSLENQDIRNLEKSVLKEPIELVLIDVSFISLKEVLPKISELILAGTKVIALFKPQFEVGKENIGARGIVRDQGIIDQKIAEMIRNLKKEKLKFILRRKSTLKGKKGNQEDFLLFEKK